MKSVYKIAHVKSQINQTNRNLQEFCGKTHNWELRQRGRQQELSLSQRSLSLGSLKQKEGIPENGSAEIKARQAQWDMMFYAQWVERLGWVESECRKVVNGRVNRRMAFHKPECWLIPNDLWAYILLLFILALTRKGFGGQVSWSPTMLSFIHSFPNTDWGSTKFKVLWMK